MPEKKLVVIGDGPDFKKIKAKGKSNVSFLGYQKTEVLKDYLQRAKAFVFAAEEDFGLLPVEAQACGTPVIAFGKGGAVEVFEKNHDRFLPEECRKNAEKFSVERFRREFKGFVDKYCVQFEANMLPGGKRRRVKF